MKIRIFLASLLSLMVMAAVSCTKEQVKAPNIEFDKNEVTVPAEGGEAVIKVISTRDWTAKVEDGVEGISVNPAQGVASDNAVDVTIKAEANEGSRRSVTITFTAGNVIRTVKVNQAGQQQSNYTSLADVRAMAPADQSQKATIADGVVVKVFVISNKDINNLTSKKNAFVQDETAGIQIRFSDDCSFAFGDEIEISLAGQELSYFGGALQVNNLPLANASVISSGNKIEAKEVTVAEFMKNTYDAQYVALPDVQVKESDLEKTFVMNESHTSINVEDATGNSFVIFSSKYTTFGDQKVPQGAGTLKGISMINNGTMQIGLTSADDCAAMTGERFEGAPSVDIDKTSENVGKDAGSFEIKVTSNADWTVESSDSSWLTVDPASGNGDATVTVSYTAFDGDSRQAELTFKAGSAEKTCTVTQQGKVEEITVADFLKLEKGNTYYRLSGTIKAVENTTYGNFTLEDETGSVYVYGLTATKQSYNDKSFSTLGLKEGDKLVLEGTRDEYNGEAQVGGPAYYISHEPGEGGGEPDPEVVKATVAEFLAAAVSEDVIYELTGTITSIINTQYGNLYIEDETGTAYIYGVKASEDAGNQSFGEIEGLNVGDILTVRGFRGEYQGAPQMVNGYYVSHVDGEEPEDPGMTHPLTSNVTWVPGESFASESATINGTADVNVFKFGTSKNTGSATIDVPKGTTKIGFYAVGWSGKVGSIVLSVDGSVIKEITAKGNSGASNNQPYTIESSDNDYYEVELDAASAALTLKFETKKDNSGNRAILWGVNLY